MWIWLGLPTWLSLKFGYFELLLMDDAQLNWNRHCLLAGTVAITVLCAQYTNMLMASTQATTSSAEMAQWNDQEVTALVNYLHEHQAEDGDGESFKGSTFNAAATQLVPFLTLGSRKTGTMCKTKWLLVS